MRTFIALLRGINVGGRNKMKMAELRALCVRLGFQNVRSYIQSGNLILESSVEETVSLEKTLRDGILEEFQLDIPVLFLTTERLLRAFSENPFVEEHEETPQHLHVAFLQASPTKEAVDSFVAPAGCEDEFVLSGTEVFLHFPRGAGRSKLNNAWLEKRLEVSATSRNRKTLAALVQRIGEG